MFASFRSHVLLPQTGDGLVVIQSGLTETGTAGGKKRQRGEDRPVVFMCFMEQGIQRKMSAASLSHIFLFSLSLWLMERQSPPHSSARPTTTCVAWRGRELSVINLTTSLTAH